MKSNIRKEIIISYVKLIRDCRVELENGVDIDKNEFLIKEYKSVLNKVCEKTDEEYNELESKISELYEFSLLVSDYLSPLRPYRYNIES